MAAPRKSEDENDLEATQAWMRQRTEELKRAQNRPHHEVRIEGGGPFAPRQTQLASPPRPPPRRTLDPRKQDVFVQGPDGKLHPVPGWRTTGPHDYGAWARMIDWEKAGKDLYKIRKRAKTFMKPDPVGWARTLVEMGQEMRDDLNRVTEPPPRRD